MSEQAKEYARQLYALGKLAAKGLITVEEFDEEVKRLQEEYARSNQNAS